MHSRLRPTRLLELRCWSCYAPKYSSLHWKSINVLSPINVEYSLRCDQYHIGLGCMIYKIQRDMQPKDALHDYNCLKQIEGGKYQSDWYYDIWQGCEMKSCCVTSAYKIIWWNRATSACEIKFIFDWCYDFGVEYTTELAVVFLSSCQLSKWPTGHFSFIVMYK